MHTDELCRRSGLTRRQIEYWIRQGALTERFTGTGHDREWDDVDLADATLLRMLTALRDSHRNVTVTNTQIVTAWRDAGRPDGYIVVAGRSVTFHDDIDIGPLLGDGHATMIVPTPTITGDDMDLHRIIPWDEDEHGHRNLHPAVVFAGKQVAEVNTGYGTGDPHFIDAVTTLYRTEAGRYVLVETGDFAWGCATCHVWADLTETELLDVVTSDDAPPRRVAVAYAAGLTPTVFVP